MRRLATAAPISVGMQNGADRFRRMKPLFLAFLAVCFAVAVEAESPRIDSISLFKHSVGTWTGIGRPWSTRLKSDRVKAAMR